MQDCLFCKIMKGEIPTKTVYEDDTTKVFMDINPLSNGHLLIVPKKHQENILDIDDDFIVHAFTLIRQTLYPLLKDKLKCDDLTIQENNFYGQDIRHFHIHLIPRYKNDDFNHTNKKENLEDIDTIYKNLTEK